MLEDHPPKKQFTSNRQLKRVLGQVKSTGQLLRRIKFIFSTGKNAVEKVTEVFSYFHNEFSLAEVCPTFLPHSHTVVALQWIEFSIASKGKLLIIFNCIATYHLHKKKKPTFAKGYICRFNFAPPEMRCRTKSYFQLLTYGE